MKTLQYVNTTLVPLEWVAVEDALPLPYRPVLVWYRDVDTSRFTMAWLSVSTSGTTSWNGGIGTRTDSGTVTHWAYVVGPDGQQVGRI